MAEKYTTNELMAVTASRLLRDSDNIVVGLGLPQIAAQLAKTTHAPNLNIVYEIGSINPDAIEMGVGIADPRLWYQSQYFTSFVGTMGHVLQKGMIDVGFLGALQVDKHGNLNSTHLKTSKTSTGIRHFNGSGGAADMACFSKRIMAVMKHDKRKFVDKVDFLTSVGYLDGSDSRSREGLPMCEYIKIITNLCVFGFDNEERVLAVETLHPGISVQEVIDNTGIELSIPEAVKRTDEPTEEEISLLRNQIDPLKMFI
ncbi:MAG TPA: hypothetical protein GXZ27_04065 [Thermoanaerobacterales bacterium]|jgi:acyl CoA:acetate/3-ketoacid CoA transferase beta subunit|nr:hypothetical protein [Thermoanaerobacterales bacterium]